MHTGDESIHEYLRQLSSRAATPGGGSASALVGAVAAALCAMVARLNDRPDGEPAVLHALMEQADGLRDRLLMHADEDVAAFTELMACWKLPADVPDRHARTQAATIRATEAPLAIMDAARDVLTMAVECLAKSKKGCISDAGVAGLAAYACVESARLNVMINLPGIHDIAVREGLAKRARMLRGDAAQLAGKVSVRIETLYPS